MQYAECFSTSIMKASEIFRYVQIPLVPYSLLSHIPDHPLTAQERNYSVVFYWVPDHAGLTGSDASSATAREAGAAGTPSCVQSLGTDIHVYLCQAVYFSW